MFMESWILRVSCKVSEARRASLTLHETRSIRASLTLHETRSIHDSMNIPKIEFISEVMFGVKRKTGGKNDDKWRHAFKVQWFVNQ